MKKTTMMNGSALRTGGTGSRPGAAALTQERIVQADLSRRGFLGSLGAFALAACGGASNDGGAGSPGAATMLPAVTAVGGFVHPGLLHTDADFQRMQAKAGAGSWKASLDILLANPRAQLTYTPSPQAVVYRGYDGVHPENYARLFNDVAAAYACALRWKLSGNSAYADKSVAIMNAWSSTLGAISGTSDHQLAAGIYGYEFANAAEIMRGYGGWKASDFARFQGMMRNIFYPISHDFLVRHNNTEITHYWANWDLCNMASVLAIGVLCDDQALFDEAVTYFKSGPGNGAAWQAVYYVHPGYLGQWQETGRDQGHNTLGIALMGAMCEMAWNQGVDLYGFENNRFLMGAEYVAKANLIESGTTYYTVPYVRYTNIDRVNQTKLSTTAQGALRPCWALVYNHYVNRKGLAAPYTARFALKLQPEGGGGNYGPNSGGFDQLGYGTLTHQRDPIAAGAPPSGLSAYVNDGNVILSWWGGAHAHSYSVQRSALAAGPFVTIASGITDLLSHTDPAPADGVWYYRIVALTAGLESAPSNTVRIVAGISLHAHWKLDDGAGPVAADSSGQGYAATLSGAAGWGAGRRGGALVLDGAGGHAALPANLMAGIGDFTIAAWVYWNAARTWDKVFDFGSGSGHYLMLTARYPNGVARFTITVNGREGEVFVDSTAALPRGAWSHVAVTLRGRVCKLYVNGSVVGSNNAMFLAPCHLQNTSRSFLGRSQSGSHPTFNGKLDDFRIYHGALAQEDLVLLMNDLERHIDLGGRVRLTQQGALYHRVTQKFVGALTITNTGGPALQGTLRLVLRNLAPGVTLDGAAGSHEGAPYLTVEVQLAPGAALTVPLTFTNPARGLVSYTPALLKRAF